MITKRSMLVIVDCTVNVICMCTMDNVDLYFLSCVELNNCICV